MSTYPPDGRPGDRYDHRDAEQRAQDLEEPLVIDTPIEEGAVELREEAEEAIRSGDVDEPPPPPRRAAQH